MLLQIAVFCSKIPYCQNQFDNCRDADAFEKEWDHLKAILSVEFINDI